MDPNNRIFAVLLSILIVASLIASPVMATTSATQNPSTEYNTTGDTSSIPKESISTNTSPNTSAKTNQSQSEKSDTAEKSSTTAKSIKESYVKNLAYTPAAITPPDLQSDYTINRNVSDINIPQMDVDNWPEVKAGAKVEGFIHADVPPSQYPFKYPITVTISAINPTTGDTVATKKTQVMLQPNIEQTNFSSITLDSFKESDLGAYTAYVNTYFTFDQQSDTQYEFRMTAESKYSGISESNINTFTVTGQNDSSTANIDTIIHNADGYRQLSTTARVTRYKASTSQAGYMEDLSLPVHKNAEPVGKVKNFTKMTSINHEGAIISSENENLRITTAIEYIEPNSPQTLIIRYSMTGQSPIQLVPIDAGGREIDLSTSYTLQQGSQSRCIEGSITSVCTFTLSDKETDYINKHGELFLSFESSGETQAKIMCESVVGGGLKTSASNVCGLSEPSAASPVYSPIISQFTLVQSGSTLEKSGDDTINIGGSSPSNFDVTAQVMNAGTEPLQAGETIEIFNNKALSSGSTVTRSRTVNETPDNNTYTFSVPSTPTKNITFQMKGQSNSGVIELNITDGNGDIYRTYSNLGSSSSGDGTVSFNLADLGGTTDTVTVTVNAISYKTSDNKDDPVVSSLQVTAEDYTTSNSALIATKTLGSKLNSGETQRFTFSDSEIDLKSLLSSGSAVTLQAEFGADSDKLIVRTADSDARLIADAGGPYKVNIPVDSWEREQSGIERIKAVEQPGPKWESLGSTTSSSSTTTWTTTHRNVPRLNTSGMTETEIINYYKTHGYVNNLQDQLPKNYQGEMQIKEIRYRSYKGMEKYVGSKKELKNATVNYTINEMNWRYVQTVGEDLENYEKDLEAKLFKSQDGSLNFNTDAPGAIYYFGSGSTYLASGEERKIKTVKQHEKPNRGRQIDNCLDLNSSYPCWDKGELVGTKQVENGYVQRECYSDLRDNGPDWYYAGQNSSGEYCWERVTNASLEIYKWHLIDEKASAKLFIPQFTQYSEWERPTYDIQIVWSKPRESGTLKKWEGPRYDVQPVSSTGGQIILDGSSTRKKSTISSFSDYQWYIDGKKVSGDLGYATSLIKDPGKHKVKLTVKGGGLTDSDTTYIDATAKCPALSQCDGSVHPSLSITRAPTHLDIKYRTIALETTLNEGAQFGDTYKYRLKVSPAESVIRVKESDSCPTGYSTSTATLPEDSDQVKESELVELNGGSKTITLCNKTEKAPDSGPIQFIHPNSLSDTDLRTFPLESNGEKVFWTGKIPDGGLKQVTYINPRMNASINVGKQKFTVSLEAKNTTKESSTWQEVDETTRTITLCQAYRTQNLVESGLTSSCAKAGYDSDLDTYPDKDVDGDSINQTDVCPYLPSRDGQEYGVSDCDPLPAYGLTFGSGQGTNGWQVATSDDYNAIDAFGSDSFVTDEMRIGTQPEFGTDGSYDPKTVELFHESIDVMDGGIHAPYHYAHWPLNQIGSSQTIREVATPNSTTSKIVTQAQTNKRILVYGPDGNQRKTISSLDPDTWDSSTAASFVYRDDSETPGSNYASIALVVEDSERSGTGSSSATVTTFIKPSNNPDIDDGQTYASKWSYIVTSSEGPNSVEAPAGRAIKINNNHKSYLQLMQDGDELAATIEQAHEKGYNISFWFNTQTEKDKEKHVAVLRKVSDGKDKLVITSEEKKYSWASYDYYSDTSTNGLISQNATMDDFILDTTIVGSEEYKNRIKDELVSTSLSGPSFKPDDGDKLKYLYYTGDGGSHEPNVIQWWNLSDPSPYAPSDVTKSEYYTVEFTPLTQSKQIVAQLNYLEYRIVGELSYTKINNYMSEDSETSLERQLIAHNKDRQAEAHLLRSGFPYFQLQGENGSQPIRPRTSGWEFGTLNVTGGGCDSCSGPTPVSYYENGEKLATVQLSYDTSYEITHTGDSAPDQQLQLFFGAGQLQNVGLIDQITTDGFGGYYTGQISGVRITKRGASVSIPEEKIYTTKAKLTTKPRHVNVTNGEPETTFTKENIGMQQVINWKDNISSESLQSTTTVTIRAIPTDAKNSSVSSTSAFVKQITYYPTTDGSGETVVKYPLGKNGGTLDSTKKYTGFKLRITINTLKNTPGWMTPDVKRIDILDYDSDRPIPPPTIIEPTNTTEQYKSYVMTSTDMERNSSYTGDSVGTMPQPSMTDRDGGGVNLVGVIKEDWEISRTVNIEFRVRDNNTKIGETQIYTSKSAYEVLNETDVKESNESSLHIGSATTTWEELNNKGITPRDQPYVVEAVIKPPNNAEWGTIRVKIGEFIMCGSGAC